MEKKSLVLIGLLFTSTLFADPTMSNFSQDPRTGFASSAARQSTMFTMGTEADSIHAKGIVDIVRPFFATGYIGNGGVTYSPILQGVGAFPIGETMAFGAIIDYKINAFRDEQSQNNIATDTSNTRTDDSTYNARIAFAWNDFGIHSRVSKTGNETDTIEEAQRVSGTKDTKEEYEVGVSYRVEDVFNFYSTIGGIYDRTTNVTDSYVDSDGATTVTEKRNAVTFFAFPQIEFPVSFGPLVTLRTGVNIGVDVHNIGDAIEHYSTVVGDETNSITATFKDRENYTIGIDGGASLAWFKEKILVLAEPYVGFDYARRADTVSSVIRVDETGTSTTSNPNDKRVVNSYDTYAGLNIGISIKPTDWFEFRGGLSYGLNWDSTDITTEIAATKESTEEYDFHLTTTFLAGVGVGFVLAEDFLLDINIESLEGLFTDATFGVSALYRF